ncbi:uncharacterized protein K452DRAFT_312815 [Aplosporella prunicola CBS 121167]|uniref:Uncharacterized protein n=1 Tax=Aplosporella prunicola CBS 121167 TaxID=1176127 RepID=A0A6A6AY86_9PEZI|nr:uncharacterized protein K452DRAFT_312815 [Aplosporella prunicola CBS 121167]KAF2136902.1 hypothetical protein K452DRAFT_312815 [Aplosporella prunicola CBS 121167]
MAGYSTLTSVLLLASQLLLHCRSELVDTNYFLFPLKAGIVPTVHNGDTVNVTWRSEFGLTVLYHVCQSEQMAAYPNQPANGHVQLAVNASWTAPCHWQLAQQGDEETYFDSGQVDVTNARATPAVMWVPADADADAGESCARSGAGSATASASASAAASASESTAGVSEGGEAACDSSAADYGTARRGLGTGPSVGVGVVSGVLAGGLVGVCAFLVQGRLGRRRWEQRGEKVKAAGMQ